MPLYVTWTCDDAPLPIIHMKHQHVSGFRNIQCQDVILATGCAGHELTFPSFPGINLQLQLEPCKLQVKIKLLTAQDTTDVRSFCRFSLLWLFFFFNRWTLLIFTFLLTFCCPNLLLTSSPHPPTHWLWQRRGMRKQSHPWELPQRTGTTQKTGLRSAECGKTLQSVVCMLQLLHTLPVICSHKKICQ